jgi:hypothetical protein
MPRKPSFNIRLRLKSLGFLRERILPLKLKLDSNTIEPFEFYQLKTYIVKYRLELQQLLDYYSGQIASPKFEKLPKEKKNELVLIFRKLKEQLDS